MTKDNEIAILREAAKTLGAASYLGPWLSSIIDELERDLRSDFVPVLTLAEARQRAEYITAEARNTAEAHFNRVKAEAEKALDTELSNARRVRQGLYHDLNQALKALN